MTIDSASWKTPKTVETRGGYTPRLPDPVLRNVANFTPFAHFQYQKMGKGRVYYDCLVVKATFDLAKGPLALSSEQAGIVFADQYHDDNADQSSLVRVGDLHLPKPGSDVVLTGHAEAPEAVPLDQWRCEVVVRRGSKRVLRHAVNATGPRQWTRSLLGGWDLLAPSPVTSVPIRYELAYGGHFKDSGATSDEDVIVYPENPSGTGFFSEHRMKERMLTAPQWELPEHPLKGPNRDSPLAGFGPIARMWRSRYQFGGTYDAAWHARFHEASAQGIAPDYPADFDPRYFHAAHPALRSEEPLQGDERIELRGFVAAEAELTLQLPGLCLNADLRPIGAPWQTRSIPLDLVHIDLGARKVHLAWRVAFDPVERIFAAGIHLDSGEAS